MKGDTVTALNGVTASSTSNAVGIGDYRQVSFQFIGASISSGNGVFSVQLSNDGTNWTTYNRLVSNATNTNSQTDTRVASVTVSANGASFAFKPTDDVAKYARVIVVRTTDGAYSCVMALNQ